MLILTRKQGEVITIGEQVRIEVISVKGSQVRLKIDAPREVRIMREELLDKDTTHEVDTQE
ncbi:MAG: carbon storage regulator [Mariprofundaceae bacterium]